MILVRKIQDMLHLYDFMEWLDLKRFYLL